MPLNLDRASALCQNLNTMKALLFCLAFFLASHTQAADKLLVIVGDSISEGYGVSRESAYPYLLEKKLKTAKLPWKVVSSSISGSTSASAPSRMEKWVIKMKPQAVLIALGGNDGLRGLSPKEMEKNLIKALEIGKKSGAKVFLAGVPMPPNFGKYYLKDYQAAFPRIAKETKAPLLSNLLEKVGGALELNQDDRIHPNEKGHAIIAETVFNFLKDKL